MKPILYLLCGLPGTGKTTYAKTLENKGYVRYSPDELFLEKYRGQTLTPDEFAKAEQKIKDSLFPMIEQNLREGISVILDFGFWKKKERDTYKSFAEEHGALWKLIYFHTPKQIQLDRLATRETTKNHKITPELLSLFVGRFEAPQGEGEEKFST